MRVLRCCLLIAVAALLTGCKTELYSKLNEKEANTMLALLLESNISAEKRIEKDNLVSLHVDNSRLSAAVSILNRAGLPSEKFADVEDIFPQDGLISSPTAERARFMYVLSQSISDTLAKIDGVIEAKVHVVVPKEKSNTRIAKGKPSASVFIKHVPELSLEDSISQIKLLVSSSVEGLSYDNVNVVLFASNESVLKADERTIVDVLTIAMDENSVGSFWLMISVLVVLLVASIILNAYFFQKYIRQTIKVEKQ